MAFVLLSKCCNHFEVIVIFGRDDEVYIFHLVFGKNVFECRNAVGRVIHANNDIAWLLQLVESHQESAVEIGVLFVFFQCFFVTDHEWQHDCNFGGLA